MEREKNENTIRMIQELTDAAGASGFEDEVILTAKKYGEETSPVFINGILASIVKEK